MAEAFCEFGMLPVSQCAHCREQRPPWVEDLRPLTPAEQKRWMDARYGGERDVTLEYHYLTDPLLHARISQFDQQLTPEQIQRYVAERWRTMHAIAYPAEQPWAELAETATGDLGVWMLAQYDGRCRGCGERIYEGDSIRYSELEGGFLCLDCGAGEE